MKTILSLALVALLSGCATGEIFQPIHYAEGNAATVYVARSSGFTGIASTARLFVDNRHVANIGPGEYLSMRLKPGVHRISTDDRTLSLTLKPNETVYCRVWFNWSGDVDLVVLPTSRGQAMMAESTPLQATAGK